MAVLGSQLIRVNTNINKVPSFYRSITSKAVSTFAMNAITSLFSLLMVPPILRLRTLKYIQSYWRYYYLGLQPRLLSYGTGWAWIEQVLTLCCMMLG